MKKNSSKYFDASDLSAMKDALLALIFGEKPEAIRKGDLETLREIEDRFFYASLDPDSPDYEEKVADHKRRRHIRDAARLAEKVIESTGEAMSFIDKLNAINDAVDRAVESFDQISCPKHAADLLGLIACQDLLLESEPIIDLGSGRKIPTDH